MPNNYVIAKTLLYEHSQRATFPDTIKNSTTNEALDNKDALLPYSSFMDGNLIPAQGRLRHSPMLDAIKYPIVLHAKGTFNSTYDQKNVS